MADVGFTLNDLFEFFVLKGGKVVYSEIVTNFKSALSNPETLAEARNQFKDHVNTLATVTNENGTKYLVLRPKFMKKLTATMTEKSFSRTASTAELMTSPIVPNAATSAVGNGNVPQKQPPPPPSQPSQSQPFPVPQQAQQYHPQYPNPPPPHLHQSQYHSNGGPYFEAAAAVAQQQAVTRPSPLMMNNGANVMAPPASLNYHHQQSQNNQILHQHYHHQQQQQQLPAFPGDSAPRNVISSSAAPSQPNVSSPLTAMAMESSSICSTTPVTPDSVDVSSSSSSEAPPRPPPRKKASFSKSRPLPPASSTASAQSAQTPETAASSMENQENQKPLPPTPTTTTTAAAGTLEKNHTVKKEIQELARTPGRVKEHAQILNKLALSSDQGKLPLTPTTTTTATGTSSAHANVVAKIRNGFHNSGDSDSGSIQITDTLKKRWIIAASNCDYAELCSLLKEDANLAAYADFISGFTALHWAAKFNRPNIIKLLVGRYGIDPNCRSFSGSTPLHLAAQFGHQAIVQLLTDMYGAREDIRDNYGKKALQYLEAGDRALNCGGRADDGHTGDHHHLKTAAQNNGAGGVWPANGGSNGGGKNGSASAAESAASGTGGQSVTPKTSLMSLRNKISHQSMLVRNKLRQSKAIVQKRKSSFSNK